jgi:hypothetical protein
MRRRRFLRQMGAGLALLHAPFGARPAALSARGLTADVAVIGGGLGGCAAALAALRAGKLVVMTEPTDWIGGQLTSQAVPPDEHPWIEQFGGNASYHRLRDGIRAYYRDHYPLTEAARRDPRLNPGNGGVSRLCHEPRVALAVLTAMLAPYASAGRLLVLHEHLPVHADLSGDRIRTVTLRDLRNGEKRFLTAPFFLDATELGDLLPIVGAEFVTGAESRDETGEPHAPAAAQPLNQQAITVCFALEHRPGETHTIDRPADYDFWRDYVPELTPAWPGKLLAWETTQPITREPVNLGFDPTGAGKGFWVYRRIQDPSNLQPDAFPGTDGITLVNWPQNDYWLGPLVGVSEEEVKLHLDRARQLSLSLLYWMQTEAPRPDGGTGWPGLKLRGDLVGDTPDGLAKAPYIRESRRIRAEFTVVEDHVGTDARRAKLGRDDVAAERFDDSVGVGSYRIDLHPSTGGDNYIDVSSLPFQVPLGALIPVRLENLLPACKNLGVTHITNGCYRLHPVEWAIGEAAGALAAYCLDHKTTPRAVRNNPDHLAAFQARLRAQGVETDWPRLTPR